MCSDTRFSPVLLAGHVNKIKQRKQINPQNIDKVPVQADDFHGRVVLRRETAAERSFDEPNEKAGVHDHVQGVQAGHGEIQREIKLAVVVNVRIGRDGFLEFLFLTLQFFQAITGQGMRRMVAHVKAMAGNEMVVELLLVLDGFDAKKDSAESKSGDQENTDQFPFS